MLSAGPDGGKPIPEVNTATNETYFLIKGGKLVGGASAEPTLLFSLYLPLFFPSIL